MPNGQYGRDSCIACLRRLGFGAGVIARRFNVSAGTIIKITNSRIAEDRYTGHDKLWATLRNKTKKVVTEDRVAIVFSKARLDDIKSFAAQESTYNSMYRVRFKSWRKSQIEKAARARAKRRADPEKLSAYYDKQRVRQYAKKGIPQHLIPEKGTYHSEVKLSPEEQKKINKIRRKRNYLRKLVREVWRGEVGDSAARWRVDCSVKEFQLHIASTLKEGWSEINYGKVWNFDHIIPCVSFDVFNPDDVKRLNHFSNIRALCVLENSTKSGNL